MRTTHNTYTLDGFPIYSLAFLSDNKVVLGGGGGQGRTGVKNKLRLYDVNTDKLDLVNEYELEAGADAPMSMAYDPTTQTVVCGANASLEKMARQENMHCRMLSVKGDKIAHVKSVKAINDITGDAYQKVTVLSPSNDILAVGSSTNEVHLLHYPSLNRAAPLLEMSAGDLFDVSFSATRVAIASSTNIFIHNLHEDKQPAENMLKAKNAAVEKKNQKKKKGGKKGSMGGEGEGENGNVEEEQLESLELATTLVRPKIRSQGKDVSSFRAVRFHPRDSSIVYAVLNTTGTTGKRARKSYIVKYGWVPHLKNWPVIAQRKIGDGSITSFDITADGLYLAYGASDCSIGILDAKDMALLFNVLGAHEFPSTALRFSPNRQFLISASADSSVRVITLPEKFERKRPITSSIFLVIILIAVLVQLYLMGYLNPNVLIGRPSHKS
ncbi:WD40 repeat-like protein [Serendipita vermifera]|nr:WD40 repeat-like protein [Serendipita vermifera]